MRFEYPRDIRFKCKRCALCCGDTKNRDRSVLMMKIEAYRISRKTLIDLDELAEKIEGFEPYVYQMRKTENGKCFFLKDNLCSIYQIRPLICRFYPFKLQNLGNNKYVFAYTKECPGIGKKSLLKRDFFEKLFREFMEVMRKNHRDWNRTH